MRRERVSLAGEKGATLLESALVLPLLIVILVVSVDILRLGYNVLTVRYVTTTVMRQAVIGNMNALQIQNEIIRLAGNFATPLEAQDVSMCRLEDYPCTGMNVGNRNDLMVLEVRATPGSFMLGVLNKLRLSRRVFAVDFRVIGKIEP